MKGTILEAFPTTAENKKNRQVVVDEWHLGPEKTSIDPKANRPYWAMMAKVWMLDEKQARRRFCANCEYFDNTPGRQAQMEDIKLDEYDTDGGGRGYCVKFMFACHNLRTCQAWEQKEFEAE